MVSQFFKSFFLSLVAVFENRIQNKLLLVFQSIHVKLCFIPNGTTVVPWFGASCQPTLSTWDSWIWRFRCLLLVPYLETLFFKIIFIELYIFLLSPPFLPSPLPSSPMISTLPICSVALVFFSFLYRPTVYDKITFLNNANTLSLKLSIKPTSILFCLCTGIIGTIPSGIAK